MLKNVCGEANKVLPTTTVDCILHSMLSLILEEYDLKNVFKTDKTDLFYCCLPDKTLSFKGQSCSGEKNLEKKNHCLSWMQFRLV